MVEYRDDETEDDPYQVPQVTKPTPAVSVFDPSKVSAKVPVAWAQDFLARNPGDYHRIEEAYASEGGPKTPQSPSQQWAAQPAPDPRSDQLYSLLMQRATQGTAVSRNDPNIRAQVDPVVAQQERASRNYLDDIAEQAGPLANIQGERRLASERSGQAAGAFESEVMGREIAARRDEIQAALSQMGAQLSDQQRQALQRELAALNDATQRYGIDTQASLSKAGMDQSMDQFLRELALREYDLNNTWDYRWGGLGA